MNPALPRRRLLAGAGFLGLAGLVAACSGEPPAAPPTSAPAGPPATSTPASSGGTYTGDLQLVALCAALAALVADVYDDAGTGAGRGRYGQVPGVVTTLLSGAGEQHTAAATAWNQVLTAAGRPAVSGTPLRVESQYRARLEQAVAPLDLLGLVSDLEATVGATVTAAIGQLTDPSAIAVATGVAPVAAMHGATAAFLVGRLPAAPGDPTAGALGRDALLV